jgi:anti-anti-sigma factor
MEVKQMKHGYALIFKCMGKWDAVSTSQFWDEVEHRLMDGEEIMIFDLSQLSYLNARGVISLVKAVQRLESIGGESAIVKGPGLMSDILDAVQLDQFTELYDSLDEALESFDE